MKKEIFDNDKRFKNKICRSCWKKNVEKYGAFNCKCDGITVKEDVAFAIKNGMSEHEAKWAYDPTYFFEQVYGSAPRWYQIPILLCSSKNLVTRQCRQSGKTLAITIKIMHYIITNERKDVIILTPQEKQIKKIFDEYIHRDCIGKSKELKASLVSSVQKPYYQVTFDNGSTVKLMVANEGARGQTCSWLYIDEAALIGTELLNSILMTVASNADNAVIIMTSTPRGRGNLFYKSCKEDFEFNEYHVPISEVEEMSSQINRFKKLLGETGYLQECEAEFPDISGGPFNLKGISLAKGKYEYEDTVRNKGLIYIGGVDWNGPSVGTYIYVISFNVDTLEVMIVDKKVVASASWNSTVAKNTLIELNRKWMPKHWMADYGYGHDIIESLKLYSIRIEKQLGSAHPDSQIKLTLEAVEFGGIMEIKDPFTKEIVKKTTKAFIVSQTSRLFEPAEGTDYVPVKYSAGDIELIECLENYKLLNVTDRGFEQFGYEKNSGVKDHCYTPDHEILTSTGWKNIAEVTCDDLVCAPSKEGKLKFEKPSRIINNNFKGKMYEVEDNFISFKITDKHRFAYLNEEDYLLENINIQANTYKDTPDLMFAINAVTGYDKKDHSISDDEIYLYGMLQAKEAFGKNVKIEIKHEKLFEKHINRELLDNLSKRQLLILYKALTDKNNKYFDTHSIRLANDFQELCFKLGVKTNLVKYKDIDSSRSKLGYFFRIWIKKTKPYSRFAKKDIREVEYDGPVHCVTVTDGLLVVRRNGKIHIGSNCIDAFMLAIFGIVKYYNDLFKRVVYQSVPLSAQSIFQTGIKNEEPNINVNITRIGGTILLTHNNEDTVYLEENAVKHFDPDEKPFLSSKMINKGNISPRGFGIHTNISKRGSIIKRTINW